MVAAATVGAAVVGGVSSNVASNRASGAADRQTAAAERASERELQFAKERYADWKDVFGDVQDNLSDYYTNLSPEFIEAQGLEAIEQERALASERINETFAQRGLGTSGLRVQAENDLTMATAGERAQVRANAPMQTAQEQSRFLQIGLGQNPENSISNAYARNTQAQSNLAVQRQQQAATASRYANQAIQGAVETGFQYLGEAFEDDNTDGGS